MHNFHQFECSDLKIQMIQNQQQSYKQIYLHIPTVALILNTYKLIMLS